MSGAPVKLAIAGCGRIARAVHLPALKALPSARVVALADPDPDALSAARWLVPEAEAMTGLEDLCRHRDVDAVVVCLPSHLHAEAALAVLEAGKALYLEKPIAMDLDSARAVVEAGRRSARPATIGFNYRFHPKVATLRRRLARGDIGTPRVWRSTFATPAAGAPAWKRSLSTGGGVALDLLSHHVDLVRYITGQEAREVSASTTAGDHSEEEVATLKVTFDGGVVAHLVGTWGVAEMDRIELGGETGALWFDRHRRTGLAWLATRLGAPRREPSYARSLAAFVDGVLSGAHDGPTLDDGLRSLEVIAAARAAAASRQPQTVRR